MPELASQETFDRVAASSRSIHRHRYVVPVAAWILSQDLQLITTKDAMQALGGRADRARAIEALVRLDELGALDELPREEKPNAPREFQRCEDPYWAYITAKLERIGVSDSTSDTAGHPPEE